MGLAYDDGWSMPFDSPQFPPLPAHHRGAQFQFVFFEADPEAVMRLLPEPLEPVSTGLCVAMGLRVPFSTAYGSFNEAAIELRCTLDGRPGWYCSHVCHDGPAGIAAGREIYGTPKVFSRVDVALIDGAVTTRASMGGVPVISISSTRDSVVQAGELPDLTPAWRLKLIPKADRPEPAVKQLIDTSAATRDLNVHAAYRGRGAVGFEASPLLNLTSLTPRRLIEAWFVECDFTEGFATVALDYLNDQESRSRYKGAIESKRK